MKKLVKVLAAAALVGGTAGQAHAGVPVIDAANVAQAILQVTEMGKQLVELKAQYDQAVKTYNSLQGARGLKSLANDATLRNYLPNEWNTAMNLLSNPSGYVTLKDDIDATATAARVHSLADSGLSATSAAGRAFVGAQNQAATNRVLSDAGFKAAGKRISEIEKLIDKVGVTDPGEVAELQTRIQSEQVLVQNEMVKLTLMGQLMQAQRDIANQQAREISMRSTKSATGVARF